MSKFCLAVLTLFVCLVFSAQNSPSVAKAEECESGICYSYDPIEEESEDSSSDGSELNDEEILLLIDCYFSDSDDPSIFYWDESICGEIPSDFPDSLTSDEIDDLYSGDSSSESSSSSESEMAEPGDKKWLCPGDPYPSAPEGYHWDFEPCEECPPGFGMLTLVPDEEESDSSSSSESSSSISGWGY